ncbi:MAG: hypothetical protein FWG99_06780 [Treponema sp.]|nr:hypothetical protein [Treponema sp.]
MIYIFSSKNAAAIRRSLLSAKKNTWAELLPQMPARFALKEGDQAYLDIYGLAPSDRKKAIGKLKKGGGFWGIIDPKGTAEDPAAFFFDGACDYIGQTAVKKGLNKKRFDAALSWSGKRSGDKAITEKKKGQKLPAGKFEGWKSVRSGTKGNFFFLFVSLLGKSNLRLLVGDAAFSAYRMRLRGELQQRLNEAAPLLWMETEDSSLFLVPPRTANAAAVIEAALRIILDSRLIVIEKLGISVPVEFTFALHYGQTVFQAPGKTGAVISESVNYIFHLGKKRAETGRLTISGNVPDETVPDGLKEFFKNAGEFEGIPVRHSRRFTF